MKGQTDQIKGIVKQHLQGNYSDTLTRFSYLNGGAEQFIQLTQNPDYTSYERELTIMTAILPNIMHLVRDGLQIVDFGVGDGKKLNLIISDLRENMNVSYLGIPDLGGNGNVTYLGLDLSLAMINVARINNPFGTDYSICDFSDMSQLSREFSGLNNADRLIFMLGNTITNEVNVENYLQSLRSIIARQTYLVIGLELFQDNAGEIVREYRNEENYNLTFRPLELIGVERTHGQIDIGFNPERQRIEEWFVFNKDRQVRDIQYREGDRILLSVTYKPTMTQIKEMISASGWNEEISAVESGYALLILSSNHQKRRNRV